MNIQAVRVLVKARIDTIKPDGWRVSVDTRPTIHSGLIHVGHAQDIRFETMCGGYGLDLPITTYADESAVKDAAEKLYALLTPMDGSIIDAMAQTPGFEVIEIRAVNVGQRLEGPTLYLVGEFVLRLFYLWT